MSQLLKDLDDSEITTVEVFKRTRHRIRELAKKEGRIGRYYLAEIVDREYDKIHWPERGSK